MEAKAHARYVRVTPRKANQVLELIRGKDVETAQRILQFTPKYGARIAEKVLRSAVANAVDRDKQLDVAALVVHQAIVGRGPIMKRWLPRAQGRATPILKKTSHITITVATTPAKGAR
jgi:large subunit ribosomal protein L22